MIYGALSVSELKKQINRNVYCFGAGKAFDSFMKEFEYFGLERHIKAVVDNNPDRFDIPVKVVNHIRIPILSLGQILTEIKNNDQILITTAAYEEVIEQLERIEQLKNVKYYIYSIMRIEQYDCDRLKNEVPAQLSVYKEVQIPRVIHYCWFGRQEMPVQYKEWIESWKHYCPGYEIIEWNEENYDVHKCTYISQAYKMKKWAFVSDYARIDIINEYGGVYLDTDVELIKNIDKLLMNDSFCGFESDKYVAYGLGFGAKKQNKIVREIKEYYDNAEFVLKDGTINQINCPAIQTEIMKKYGLVCNGEFQIVGGMAVFPPRVLCGMSPYSFRIERDLADTYAIHHFVGSWLDNNQKKNTMISRMKKWGRNERYIYPGDE